MTAQTFNFFRFYEDYLWSHIDFDTLQEAHKEYSEAGLRLAFKEKVLGGLGFGGSLGYDITVEAGGAVDVSGRVLALTSAEEVTPSTTPSVAQGVKSLVVIRRKVELINLIDEPLNPTNQVPLNERQSAELFVIDGTLGSGVYPAKLSSDVILFGLDMPLNTTSFTSDMIDYSVSEFIRPTDELLNGVSPHDAIVSKGRKGTHRDLSALVADANLGSTIRKVLVLDSQIVENISLTQNDVELEFGKGVTMSKGSSASGMIIEGDGVTLKAPRVAGFNGGSDHAIVWRGEYGHLLFSRFSDCENEYTDETISGLSTIGTHTEA